MSKSERSSARDGYPTQEERDKNLSLHDDSPLFLSPEVNEKPVSEGSIALGASTNNIEEAALTVNDPEEVEPIYLGKGNSRRKARDHGVINHARKPRTGRSREEVHVRREYAVREDEQMSADVVDDMREATGNEDWPVVPEDDGPRDVEYDPETGEFVEVGEPTDPLDNPKGLGNVDRWFGATLVAEERKAGKEQADREAYELAHRAKVLGTKRGRSSRTQAAEMARQQREDFTERAKLAAGLEPDAPAPMERLSESKRRLVRERAASVAADTHLDLKQLRYQMAHEVSKGSDDLDAITSAIQECYDQRGQPEPMTDEQVQWKIGYPVPATVYGEVTNVFEPFNNEQQVFDVQCAISNNTVKVRVFRDKEHQLVREGDTVVIREAKVRGTTRTPTCGFSLQLGDADNTGSIEVLEEGDGELIHGLPSVETGPWTDGVLEGKSALEHNGNGLCTQMGDVVTKNREGYANPEHRLGLQKIKLPNGEETEVVGATNDHDLVRWAYPTSVVPDMHLESKVAEGRVKVIDTSVPGGSLDERTSGESEV